LIPIGLVVGVITNQINFDLERFSRRIIFGENELKMGHTVVKGEKNRQGEWMGSSSSCEKC